LYFGLTPYFKNLLIATVVLFLTTFLIACIFLIRLDSKNKLIQVINIILVAWFYSLVFKTLLLICNSSWDGEVREFFFINQSYTVNFLWLILPFIIVLMGIFLIRNNLNELLRLIGSFGIAFFLVFTYRVVDAKKAFHITNWTNNVSYPSTSPNKRKVIWIVFDEFDPEIAFSDTNLPKLRRWESLQGIAIQHEKMYAPSYATIMSIPAMLMGVPTNGNDYINVANLSVKSPNNINTPFKFENTIFNRLAISGFKSSILGFYHPYCGIFSEIKCTSFPNSRDFKWYSGIVDSYSHNGFLKILNRNNAIASNVDPMAYITKQQLDLIRNYILDGSVDFSFLHLNVPHLPATFAKYKYNQNVEGAMNNYLLNLKLTDSILEKILSDITKLKEKKVLLILSSDHWFRGREAFGIAHPALFMAKINDDNEKIIVTNPTSSIYIQDIVEEFLNNKISNHSDIAKYLVDKKLQVTYMGPADD
jgi:hypothetical protein